MTKTKIEHKLWLYVIGTMAVVAVLWVAVFYPHSLKKSGPLADKGFSGFKNKIENALAIFKKNSATAPAEASEVDALRERVFGDSAERVK